MTYTPEPASRETDVKVARAMGWRNIRHERVQGIRVQGTPPRAHDLLVVAIRCYTTDSIGWDGVSEMIRWLEGHSLQWAIARCKDGMIECEALPTDDQHTGAIAKGETAGLAVGRVVLGVAEAMVGR